MPKVIFLIDINGSVIEAVWLYVNIGENIRPVYNLDMMLGNILKSWSQ